jgi:predicted AlkP superfamily phosphohydrolase/phosphomutase
MQDSEAKKVFIFGLDGATYNIIKPMIKKGKLPTFSKLIIESAHCILNSTVLTNSAPAWTSFATGKNPGKHSISGFTRLIPTSYQLTLLKGSDNKAKTIWEILSDHGKKSIVMNIPMTYPPKKINGLLVSGLDTPSLDSDFTYPPELKNELLKVVPDYKINLHLGGYLHSDKRRRKAIDVMLSSIRAREKAVLYLMKNYPWDFFTVRFNSPDNVQHQFWRFMDKNHPYYDPKSPDILKNAIYIIYEELDKVLASIKNSLPEGCTLIIMSDHGAGPRTNKTIRLNEWLQSLGYLTSKVTQKKHKRYIYKSMEKILSTLLKRVPPNLKQWLMSIFPNTISKTWTYFRFPEIDWLKTKAFVGETEGIRINRKEIYPNGIVDNKEYENLREYVIREIKKLKDPETGENVIEYAYKREEIFSGPYVNEFPDIIAIPMKDKYNISSRIQRKGYKQASPDCFIAREEHWRKVSGSHRREGIFIIHGKDVKQNLEINDSDIFDICPTALYLLGLPIPSDVDGKVITEALLEEYIKKNPIRIHNIQIEKTESKILRDEYTDDEREKLADHLRGLGYIE